MRGRTQICTGLIRVKICEKVDDDRDRKAILAMRADTKAAQGSKRQQASEHIMHDKKGCRIGEAKKQGPQGETIVKIRGDGHCVYRAMGWHLGLTHQEVGQTLIRQEPQVWGSIREDDQDGQELEAFIHETTHETWGGYAQIHVAAHIWNVCFDVRFGHLVHCFGEGRHCGLLYKARSAKDPGAHCDVIVLRGDEQGEQKVNATGPKRTDTTSTSSTGTRRLLIKGQGQTAQAVHSKKNEDTQKTLQERVHRDPRQDPGMKDPGALYDTQQNHHGDDQHATTADTQHHKTSEHAAQPQICARKDMTNTHKREQE